MGASVNNGEEQHGICQLSVHPDVLVEREESDRGADPFHNRPADGQQDEHAIDAQYQSGTS